MKYLVIAPQLGFTNSGEIIPSGLLQFGRCVTRVLSSSPSIEKLSIWCQVDSPSAEAQIKRMLDFHAHPKLNLEIKCFGGSRLGLSFFILWANLTRSFDKVMYLLINQAVLSIIPGHIPYEVWEIGEELFHPIPKLKYLSLSRANRLLSISYNTTFTAIQNNPGLPMGDVVHLCTEPPIFKPIPKEDPLIYKPYKAYEREKVVLIVANMHRRLLYKGHQQLILGWPKVCNKIPNAELWIVGDGDGRKALEDIKNSLPTMFSKRIRFFGRLDERNLREVYEKSRVFAMPSTGEGFGLVFVEAMQYGLPCIGGKHDSVKEIIINNETGLLVEQQVDEIADACIKLLEDDALAERLGRAGRMRYLENFQYANFRNRLLATLNLSS